MLARGCLLILIAGSAQAAETGFTPDAYIREVIAASPESKKAHDDLRTASARWKSEFAAAFFPALSFTGTLTPAKLARDNRFTFGAWRGAANDIRLTPGASWNLFNSFADSLSVRTSRLSREVAREDLEITRQASALEAVRAYYALLLRDKLLAVAQANRKAQSEQYELTQDRYRHGMKSLSDLLKTETDWRSSELEVETAEAERRLALFKFNILLAQPEDTPVEFDVDLTLGTTEAPRLEDGLRAAPRDRPEMRKDRLRRRHADAAFKQAVRNVLPGLALDFDLSHPVSADYQRTTQDFGIGTAAYGFTLKLALPSSFNFYSQVQDLAAARAVRRATLHDSEAQRRAVREEVYRAHVNLLRATRSYQISVRKEEISRQNYEIVAEQYSQGSADVIRLSQALLDHVRAQRERMLAYNDTNISRAEYRKAIGQPIWR
ncbi:MAG: TolC family protein [Elusimicrobiota bacterium]